MEKSDEQAMAEGFAHWIGAYFGAEDSAAYQDERPYGWAVDLVREAIGYIPDLRVQERLLADKTYVLDLASHLRGTYNAAYDEVKAEE